MEKLKIIIPTSVLIIVIAICIAWVNNSFKSYDEEWMIGKTKQEIEERYGEFDVFQEEPEQLGVYILTEDKRNLFGNVDYGTRLMIFFSKDGKAISTRVESNGAGG